MTSLAGVTTLNGVTSLNGVTTLANVTTNSFAGDLVKSSHKGIRPPSSLGGHAGGQGQVPPGPASQNGLPSADLCYNGTELVVLYDYKVRQRSILKVFIK